MRRALFVIAALLLITAGCLSQQTGSTSAPTATTEKITLATTTSTYNSGLLGVLNPAFQKKYGVLVEVHAVGTGAALRMAKDGEADLVMVHARSKEDKFVEDGYGINRRNVMYNDFIIVGPKSDPAKINGMKSATDAFKKIAQAKAKFLSRGDNSGTQAKEMIIWKLAGITPTGTWYEKTGQGMGKTLTIANEKQAYTITDRGTFLAYESKLAIKVAVEGPIKGGDPVLANPYAVIAVNPKKYPDRKYGLAMLYIGFVTSSEGQKLIADYKKNGEQLFYPDALVKRDDYNQYLPVTIHGLYSDEGKSYTGVTTLPPTG